MKTTILIGALLLFCGFNTMKAQETNHQEKNLNETSIHSSRGAWLGVYISDITQGLKKEQKLKNENGAYINNVVENSPADSIGLKKGDIIISFNGKSIYFADDLVHAVKEVAPGAKVSLEILRNGEKKSYSVILGQQKHFPEKKYFTFHPRDFSIFETKTLGMKLSTLTKQLAEYFGAPDNKGVLVESVEEGSAAEHSGIKAGDVIINIENEKIQNVADVHQALEEAESGQTITVNVIRKGEKKIFKVKVPDGFYGENFPFSYEKMPQFPSTMKFHFKFPTDEELNHLQFDLQKELEPGMKQLRLHLKELENIGRNWHWNSDEV